MPECRQRRTCTALLLSCLFLFLLISGPSPAAFDAAEFEKAADAILCDCNCPPQSTFDCACGRAAQMRREIAGLIESGPADGDGSSMTGDEVIAWYVDQLGVKVLVTPPTSGFNLVAWLGPLIGLLVAAGALLMLLRHWSARAAAAPQLAPTPALDPNDPYLGKLRAELEKLE